MFYDRYVERRHARVLGFHRPGICIESVLFFFDEFAAQIVRSRFGWNFKRGQQFGVTGALVYSFLVHSLLDCCIDCARWAGITPQDDRHLPWRQHHLIQGTWYRVTRKDPAIRSASRRDRGRHSLYKLATAAGRISGSFRLQFPSP